MVAATKTSTPSARLWARFKVSDIEIRPIETAQTYPLRGAILRPGHPPSESVFPGDDAPDTFHLGAFVDQKLLGIATFFPENAPFSPDLKAYRLRGMAVAQAAQGSGLGRAIIAAAFGQLEARGAQVLWCNARTSASGFYRNLGFETVGDEFEIAGIGPHFVMWKPLKTSRWPEKRAVSSPATISARKSVP